MLQRSDEILLSSDFKNRVHAILKKKEAGMFTVIEAEEGSRILHLEIPLNYLDHIPHFLSQKYNIPENFAECIKEYLLFGIVNAPLTNYQFSRHFEGPTPGRARSILIELFAQLTKEEAAELAKWIKIYGNDLPQYQPLKDIERKLTIEKWYRERQSDFDHATNQSFKTTASDIAQEVFGSKTKKGKVYEAVREMQDLRKKRLGK